VLTLTGAPLVQRVVDVALHEQAQELVIGLPTRSVGVLPGVVAERLVRALPVGCLHRACTRGMSSMWYVGGAATKGVLPAPSLYTRYELDVVRGWCSNKGCVACTEPVHAV
jgi:hypothetical protein